MFGYDICLVKMRYNSCRCVINTNIINFVQILNSSNWISSTEQLDLIEFDTKYTQRLTQQTQLWTDNECVCVRVSVCRYAIISANGNLMNFWLLRWIYGSSRAIRCQICIHSISDVTLPENIMNKIWSVALDSIACLCTCIVRRTCNDIWCKLLRR